MNRKDVELLQLKSINDAPNSTVLHSIDTLVDELKKSRWEIDSYDIPSRYNVNTLVLLPVNVSMIYIYWELVAANRDNFVLKIFSDDKELFCFNVNGDIGNYYLEQYIPNQKLLAKLGYFDENGNFVELLSSNGVLTPSDKISMDPEENEVWLLKSDEITKILNYSIDKSFDNTSSDRFLKEMTNMQRILKYQEERLKNRVSSMGD